MVDELGRRARGFAADRTGRDAEGLAAARLEREGWQILARRLRTPSGEIDIVAERDGLTALVEVKARRTLAEAAYALQPRQQRRMVQAGEAALAMHPSWGRCGVRFDVVLVDPVGGMRRIPDAFRAEAT